MTPSRCLSICTVWTALLVVGACSRPSAKSADRDSGVRTVAVAAVKRADVRQWLTVTAEFRPYEEIDVHAKVAGYLKSIRVDVGDRVTAGQLLAVLEVPELHDELLQGEAFVKRAQEDVKRADAEVDRAHSVSELARLSSSRLASVSRNRPNLVAQQELDEAANRDRVAQAQLATANAALAAAREQLEVAKAGQSKARTLLGYSQITAPFGGVITRRYADTGAMIQAGTSSQTQARPLVQLSDIRRLRLVIPVPESAVSRVRIGAGVDLKVISLGKTFKGTIARASDRLDTETRTMKVEVDVANPSLEIKPGMFGEASLLLNETRQALVVPPGAIDRDESHAEVFVVRQRRAERVPVTLGLEAADRIELRTGVEDSDLVVVGSRASIEAGGAVEPKIVEWLSEERR
jgi:RND family efflux transporter MFP subunit